MRLLPCMPLPSPIFLSHGFARRWKVYHYMLLWKRFNATNTNQDIPSRPAQVLACADPYDRYRHQIPLESVLRELLEATKTSLKAIDSVLYQQVHAVKSKGPLSREYFRKCPTFGCVALKLVDRFKSRRVQRCRIRSTAGRLCIAHTHVGDY
jgi:hypothetical protein